MARWVPEDFGKFKEGQDVRVTLEDGKYVYGTVRWQSSFVIHVEAEVGREVHTVPVTAYDVKDGKKELAKKETAKWVPVKFDQIRVGDEVRVMTSYGKIIVGTAHWEDEDTVAVASKLLDGSEITTSISGRQVARGVVELELKTYQPESTDWSDVATEEAMQDLEMKERGHMHFSAVNRPRHYTSDPSGVECIQITRHRNFAIGNAIKYLWRSGLKDADTKVEDLRKAIWYINDEIDRLEGNV